MGRSRRTSGLVHLGLRRTVRRASDSRQVLFAVAGVALAVCLMVTVSGVALGLASQSAVESDDVDYWVVPEASSAQSVAVSVGGPKLGEVHPVAQRLAADERIDYVTPVDLRVLRLQNPGSGADEYVLAVGIVPAKEQSVAGLSTAAMQSGDPYYGDGSFDGRWTGELVFSDAAAELLGSDTGTTVRSPAAPNRSFSVVDQQEAGLSTGAGPVPVVLVHLSELQAMSGGTAADQADQLLVRTNDPSVRGDIEQLYPETDVVARGDVSTRELSTSSLPLAVAVTALLTALTVGVLLVGTMMGLEVTDDRRFLATLAAIGFSERSRSLLILVEVVTVALLGGGVGVALGFGGIWLANILSERYLGATVAVAEPLLVGAGLATALVIGVLASLYPLWLSRRTSVLDILDA